MAYYPILVGEIAKRGIKKSAMARQLNISDRTLRNKLSGISAFTWPEVLSINSCFFPEMDPRELFSTGLSPFPVSDSKDRERITTPGPA